MTRSIAVVVNRGGGAAARAGDKLVEQIESAFATAGMTAEVHAVDGDALISTIEKLAMSGAVAVGGGDGTQGCAAAVLAKAGATQGVLPLGTRNNLARQLGIPLDLEGAVKVIAGDHPTAIDLSEVNGHIFVNNASIGLYPNMVELREAAQARGLPKWLAKVPASWTVLKNLPHHRFRLQLDDAVTPVVTPLLFVGNNIYLLEAGKVGTREAMNDGKLSVFAVAKSTRLGLVMVAARSLIGRSDPAHDFAAVGDCERLVVMSHRSRIKVALDGEVKRLTTPLKFAVRPAALSVFVPA